MPLSFQTTEEIFFETANLFREYIIDYDSIEELSDEWVKIKGQDFFWRGLNYNAGKGAFWTFKITPKQAPDGFYYAGWFEFEVPDYFKFAADRKPGRRLLPDDEFSFNKDGTATEAFCSFITDLAYEAALMMGYIS